MRLTFIGTRGNIPVRSRLHRMHSAVLVAVGRRRVLIDCGEDWLGRVARLRPDAILVSHAHEDHAGGLEDGAPCGVYATGETWKRLARWPVRNRHVIPVRREFELDGLIVQAWPVEHSLIAPAVGFRVAAGPARMFYVPDVARLPNPTAALRGVDLYVGDAATLQRPLVRARGAVCIGHAPIATQLAWCASAGVRRAIFTHCGSGIVRSDPRQIALAVQAMGCACGVTARLASDGLRLPVVGSRRHGSVTGGADEGRGGGIP